MVGPLGTQSDEFQGALYATYLGPFPPGASNVDHHKNLPLLSLSLLKAGPPPI